ncbi:hypothetical protein [Paenarthrobacter sp. 4246]|uniref:hypothetical protein n=1 Tax=Paenarthrobacter sp. 4246 TaxID=3156456 RepID=UPI003398D4E5
MTRKLPPLSADVELLRASDPITEQRGEVWGQPITTLSVRYQVEAFIVKIGWTVGHPLGAFREPNEMEIQFDPEWYAHRHSDQAGSDERESLALSGLTTRILRKLPVAHAQALMRDQYEHLEVEDVKKDLSPLPSRVERDEDYVHIASAYVALAAASVEPIRRLHEWTGESPDTWLARLKRARVKGILVGTGNTARMAASFQEQSNQLWAKMRARSEETSGG